MMMALARNVPQGTASMKSGRWERSAFTGVELAGKTIGVFGLGQVGREVAQRAAALQMRVLAFDPPFTEDVAQSYGAQLATDEEIWTEADFLTFHVPLTPQTRHKLSREALGQCKDGVRVINCARGGIVDEQALLEALDSGKVAGVALDVYETEPPPDDSALIAHERVICTPHLAASTREAQSNVALQVAEQVRDVLVGGVIRNAVNVPSVDPEAYQKLQPYLELGEYMGRIQGQLCEGRLERVTVEYRGEITGHPTSPLTSAVLKGLMETFAEEGTVNLVNAPMVAQERGIRVDELKSSDPEDYASLLTVNLESEGGRRVLSGTLFGRSDPRIVRFDEYDLDAVPEGHMLFYTNDDVPGIIGRIGSTMGRHEVNIARMSCGRRQVGGKALTVLNVDTLVPDEVIDEILTDPHITWARRVAL
jgi:D-3-phosphoglycerate dehydrogenase